MQCCAAAVRQRAVDPAERCACTRPPGELQRGARGERRVWRHPGSAGVLAERPEPLLQEVCRSCFAALPATLQLAQAVVDSQAVEALVGCLEEFDLA